MKKFRVIDNFRACGCRFVKGDAIVYSDVEKKIFHFYTDKDDIIHSLEHEVNEETFKEKFRENLN